MFITSVTIVNSYFVTSKIVMSLTSDRTVSWTPDLILRPLVLDIFVPVDGLMPMNILQQPVTHIRSCTFHVHPSSYIHATRFSSEQDNQVPSIKAIAPQWALVYHCNISQEILTCSTLKNFRHNENKLFLTAANLRLRKCY